MENIEGIPIYKFTVGAEGNCKERCNVLNNGTHIGSAACLSCVHNKGADNDKNLIHCERIDEATRKTLYEIRSSTVFNWDNVTKTITIIQLLKDYSELVDEINDLERGALDKYHAERKRIGKT